jgi:pimeloyl-ACP methyl ester carboxylesterase
MRQLQTRPLQPNGTRFVFNQRTRGDQLSAPPALVEATRGERMSAFFGETYSLSLSDLLMRYPRRSRNAPTVIVGDKDVRTGVEHLAAFRKAVPDVPVEVIEGMGHFPTDFEQAEQLATVIRRRINPECADRWWCTAWIGEQFF